MNHPHISSMSFVLAAICAFPLGCTMDSQESEPVDSVTQALPPGQCSQAEAKDVLITQLVKDSWLDAYPLTRLSTDANGLIVGPSLPDAVAGDLEIINSVEEARAAVATALADVTGLAEYEIAGVGSESPACTSIPAWTPEGETIINTTSLALIVGSTNAKSWKKTQDSFSKVCSLIKKVGNDDFVDPAGDGSTNDPVSSTVRATGVTANAYGYCPTGASSGTYCKLSYATGVRFAGRSCRYYANAMRCLLY
jgi:hypothetical protein